MPVPRYVATIVALALLLASLGILAAKAHPAHVLTLIYPATGVGFAILWRFGVRWWPALLIAQFAVSMMTSNASITVAGIATIVELGTCLGLLYLMTRQRVGTDLARIRDLVQFVVSALVVTGVAGVAIAIAEWFYGEGSIAIVARDGAYWWAGDAISIIVFSPFVTTARSWQFLKPSRFRLVAALSILLLALGVAIASKGVHALLYLDLDQFKLVNDTCGHMAGDNMLKEVAQQLALVLPHTATLGRLGGDEFGCLLPDTDEPASMSVADDIHHATDRYRFHFGGNSFGVTASIGITIFGNADGDTSDSVLSRADIACYLAKDDGRNTTRVYRPSDEAMLSWHAAIHEVSQVEHALASGRLSLFCQKIAAIGKREDPHLYEVLLRLQEGGRWQSASEFLPLVQRFGLMERIDRWVLEKTCEFLATAGDPALRLSVNISGTTLNQPSFFEFAMSMPEKHGIDASRLCLEVTEGVAIQRLQQGVEAMHKLRARGFDLALDDFGAGVASFGYLHELPVSMVKLDGRFVRDLRSDPAAEVIIDSLVRIAELRGVACIAEWVESEESIEQLRRLGVAYAQGYHIGKPHPLSELVVERKQHALRHETKAVLVGR